MNIFKRISGLFSVMEDEVKSFRLLFLQSLFIGFANSYYYIVGSSLLIKNVNIKNLPNAYIIAGIGGFILIRLYKSLQRKFGITGSYKISIILFSAICFLNFGAVYYLGTHKEMSVYLAYFIMLFATPFTTIFSLGIFAQCSRLYNISQSKRLLALVVSGEIIASVIAYLSVPFLRGLINGNVSILLPVSGVIILLVFIPFNKLLSHSHGKLTTQVAAKATKKLDLSFFTKDEFYLLIGVATIFSVFAIYVVDYAYLISVRYMSSQTGIEIAEIVSVFFFMVKLGELAFSFLSGNILSNKGIRFSLLLLPLILLFAAVCAFVSGFLFHGMPIFLLAFLFLAKLTERAIRKSITTPSVKVLYQVAEPHERQEIEANIDGLLNQIATVLSGILLIIISVFFFGNDMFSLLHIFSFVCIVAFALWAFFSMKMYDNYRIKIKNFLSKLKTYGNTEAADNIIEVNKHAAEHVQFTDINNAISKLKNATADELVELVKLYNSKQALDITADKPDKVAKKLIHIYYSNHFYFSRLLITRYLQFCTGEVAQNFLQELWEMSDLVSRLELIILLNEHSHKNADVAFFERLCEECAGEIIWTEAAMHDVAILKDEHLEKALSDHKVLLTRLLFELLKVIYEPSVMQVVYEILTKENAELENQFFALELLDITLRPGLKEIIKHVLEPTTYDNKKQSLGKTFHMYHLSPQERLIEIMMNDYNLVNPELKEIALIAYNKLGYEKDVLSAFRSSSIDNIKFKAEEMHSGEIDPYYKARLDIMHEVEAHYTALKPYSSYLFNYGLFNVTHNKLHINKQQFKTALPLNYTLDMRSTSDMHVKVDTLALAILATLRQNQHAL